MAHHLPRGISPELLLSQVKNTMPYLFAPGVEVTELGRFIPAQVLREFDSSMSAAAGTPVELTHFEYFRLCVSCHYLTCATPVPTDVDNQIRRKLWPEELPIEVALEMADFVLQSRKWDFTQVSSRTNTGGAASPWASETLSGHLGEWFTLSSGAYCALRQATKKAGKGAAPELEKKLQELFENIEDEIHRHSEIFGSLWREKDGISALKAAAAIAHNFGDLDRVLDMWELGAEDPLRLRFYKLGVQPFDSDKKLRYLGRLWVAGELYKSKIDTSSMAMENHRHFALRKPRSLRGNRALLIPTGPFFDDWGKAVASQLEGEALLEVVEALRHGWDRLPGTIGYGRALRSIREVHPRLELEEFPKKDYRRLVVDAPQERFERRWAEVALSEMDDIPSRA